MKLRDRLSRCLDFLLRDFRLEQGGKYRMSEFVGIVWQDDQRWKEPMV